MPNSKLQHNISAHDAIAQQYQDRHGEIFNEIEQNRLHQALKDATVAIKSDGKQALDFGCGSGNLTAHLLNLGLQVTSADVSPKFLQMVKQQFPTVQTARLNGTDLREFPDHTFDFVATYSVLHHIPDYLAAVQEMLRVLKPGGVLFLDHEVNPQYWQPSAEYKNFLVLNPAPFPWHKLFHPRNYLNWLRRKINPRFQAEGDIHVFPDDHIEWDKIRALLEKQGAEIISEQDYLLYKAHYSRASYEKNKNRLSDMRLMSARKIRKN